MANSPKTRKSTFLPFKILGYFFFFFLCYVCAVLLHATYTDFVPEGISELAIENNQAQIRIQDSTLSFSSWNIGYAGLGKESDFFYNGGGFFTSGGKMVRSPKKLVEKNIAGVRASMQKIKSDFMLFQEVDFNSCRSYHSNQEAMLQSDLEKYARTSAVNFDVNRIPTPILEPWNIYGEANSGLSTFSRFLPSQAERHQLPGRFSWPNSLFLLDRCLALHRYPTDWGKDLVLVHLHNSAYDKDGSIKKVQMNYLKDLILKEYQSGNYVVVGGDWNQCPPGFAFDTFHPGTPKYSANPNIDANFLPTDWTWVYDPSVPTIRNSAVIYEAGKTFTTLIDFFLISPNVKALNIKGLDQGFDFSDHQSIRMEVRLL